MNDGVPIKSAEILIPKKEIDLNKWSVVACDQHTSNVGYWEDLKEYIGDAPSTLNLILPECYLGTAEEEKKTDAIAAAMDGYLRGDIFRAVSGFVFVKRMLRCGKVRKGLVFAVDLEDYSFVHGDKALIRASERTVLERIPPRLRVREKCSLELPHIMLLYDDKDDSVLSPFENGKLEKLYDFSLNADGGAVKGYLVKDTEAVKNRFAALLKKSGSDMLFAVGDGNHSLATAKQAWENEKKKQSPCLAARYALVEAVNIYSDALDFEPIHRAVFGVDAEKFISELKNERFDCEKSDYVLVSGDFSELVELPESAVLGVAAIDGFVSQYIEKNGGTVDYIHGEEELKELCSRKDAVGILLKAMKKSELFPYIGACGALPKKTFSMGEAEDKRYYLEARKIKDGAFISK